MYKNISLEDHLTNNKSYCIKSQFLIFNEFALNLELFKFWNKKNLNKFFTLSLKPGLQIVSDVICIIQKLSQCI